MSSLRLMAAPLLALAFACSTPIATHDDPPPPPSDGGTTDADAGTPPPRAAEALQQGDLVEACGRYEAELAATPSDAQAAFGAALTCGLLLPDHASITELLDQCQEPHVDVARRIFGPTGLLAKARDARRGSASLTIGRRLGSSGAFTQVAFKPDSFLAETEEREGMWEGRRELRRALEISVKDLDFEDHRSSARLSLETYYEDAVHTGNPLPKPLVDGLTVPLSAFDGLLQVELPGAGGTVRMSEPVSGQLVFRKVGTGRAGDAIVIELQEVVLRSGASDCTGCTPENATYVKLDGTISDTLTARMSFDLPFDGVTRDTTPPAREKTIVVIDRCGAISAEQLLSHLGRLVTAVEKVRGHLGVVLDSPAAEEFRFLIPGALFHGEGDLPVGIAEVRTLAAALDVGIAAGRLA
ncbi:MAG: hypothetical protein ACK4N5_20445, partial [Myxococcales bacterium]